VSYCELLSEKDAANLVMKYPSKHLQADPIPTWLLKQYVSLLTPFLTRLMNASITKYSVLESMKTANVNLLFSKTSI